MVNFGGVVGNGWWAMVGGWFMIVIMVVGRLMLTGRGEEPNYMER